MLESQTESVFILIVLGIQIFFGIGFFRRRLIIRFQVVSDHHMPDMTADVMQSATLERNKSGALHSAQANQAMAKETERACKFTNGNSVGGSVGLALESPKMHPVGSFILIGQHFSTAQFPLSNLMSSESKRAP